MNKDCLATGVAIGVLLCCALMLWFPKQRECSVNIHQEGTRVIHSYVGVIYD